MRNKPLNWTDEMKNYLLANYKSKFKKVIAEEMTEKFGIEVDVCNVKNFMRKNNLKSGIDARFQKGHESQFKGKHRPVKGDAIKYQFKKGNIPSNRLPVGSEVISSDGFIQIKVANPNIWKRKHVMMWEKENGPVPKGYLLTFLDGDRLHCELSNLRLITQGENAMLNREKRRSNNPVITDAMINLVRLKIAANKKKRERK